MNMRILNERLSSVYPIKWVEMHLKLTSRQDIGTHFYDKSAFDIEKHRFRLNFKMCMVFQYNSCLVHL